MSWTITVRNFAMSGLFSAYFSYAFYYRKPYEKDAITRKTEKVMRFKAKKSLESKLKDLFTKLNLDHVDDDTKVCATY